MALLFQEKADGIQLGKESDKCFMCEREARFRRETVQEGELNKKEVFLLHINGNRHCLCMNHFNELLGNYAIMSKAEYEESISLINQLKDVQEEVVETNTTVEEGDKKNATKATKAAKSSKGK